MADYGKWNEPISLAGVKGCMDAMEEENKKLRKALENIVEHFDPTAPEGVYQIAKQALK